MSVANLVISTGVSQDLELVQSGHEFLGAIEHSGEELHVFRHIQQTRDTSVFEVPNYCYPCESVYVVDGDTIDVNIDVGYNIKIQKRLRLLDIDTEELRSSDPERKARAYAAKEYLINAVNEADRLYVKSWMDNEGKYGRVLAWIYAEKDGKIINLCQAMIDEGFQKI